MPAFLCPAGALMNWWRQRLGSLANAARGLRLLLRYECHAQLHLLAACAVTATGLLTGISASEWSVLVLTMALVVSLEALNTALEHLADAVHPHHHPMVGRAKDVAAAAVLISAFASVIIAGLIFIPYWCAGTG